MASNKTIKKSTYDKILSIIERIDATTVDDVLNDAEYTENRQHMKKFEIENENHIINGIINGVSRDDILKEILLIKTISNIANAKQDKDPVDEMENVTDEIFMVSEQKVVETEPVTIIIGNEEIEEASGVIVTDITNNKSSNNEFNPEADYGTDRLEYTKIIRELTIGDFKKENKVAFDKTGWGTDEFLKEVSRRIYEYEIAHKLKEPDRKSVV